MPSSAEATLRAAVILVLTWLGPTTAAVSQAKAPTPRAQAVQAALDKWRKSYLAEHLDLDEPVATRRSAYARLTPDAPELVSHYDGLVQLLGHVRSLGDDSIRCFPAMLRLAAIGRSGQLVHPTRGASVVRKAAQSTLASVDSRHLQFAVMDAARGRPSTWPAGSWDEHLQAAAVQTVGALDLSVTRSILERQCACDFSCVRLAAAQALHAMGPPKSLSTICESMRTELDGRVAEQLACTTHAILTRHVDQCDTKLVRQSVHDALGMLGRTGDWRADLAVVELCFAFRNRASIEPLIATLERFADAPELLDNGQLSGVLRKRVHETLETLTGARIPADDAVAWREFWTRVEPEFVLARQPDVDAGKTSAGFFGIPIAGTRIAFVIDRSGSMRETSGKGGTRFDQARRELLAAVDALPPDAKYKVITFGDRSQPWRSEFAAPTSSSQQALRVMLKRRGPKGATDLFGGLAKALDIRTSKYGERYPSPVDEIFLLSDGAPSAGTITAPSRILTAIREVNVSRKVRIHTVFIGTSAVAANFMRRLAAENHGVFVRS